MTSKKILVAIIGGAIVGGITAAVPFFPAYNAVFVASTALVTAVVALVNGSDNTEI